MTNAIHPAMLTPRCYLTLLISLTLVGCVEYAPVADSGLAFAVDAGVTVFDSGGAVDDAGDAQHDAGATNDAGIVTGIDGGRSYDGGAMAVFDGGADFATRCAQTGVVTCIGFDNPADFNIGSGGTNGAYGDNSGILPVGSDYSQSGQDTTIKASGTGSLKFTIPPNSSANSSGSWFTNFSTDLSVQFGAGQEFYVQWRQRFSPEFIGTHYEGGGGFKQAIIGTGDEAGSVFSSCSTLELPVQNIGQRGFPMMYNSCTGSSSHSAYDSFEQGFGAFDFKLQNGRVAPYCLYSQDKGDMYFPPYGNCFGYVANEWMTFQVHVQIGARVGDEFKNSFIALWGAREGQPSELLIQWGPYNLSAGPAGTNERYGKVWLLPYNTGKSSVQTNPIAYTWYDELIVSTQKIQDSK